MTSRVMTSYNQIWKNGGKKEKLPEIPLLALLSFDAKYCKLNIDIRRPFLSIYKHKLLMKLLLSEQKQDICFISLQPKIPQKIFTVLSLGTDSC